MVLPTVGLRFDDMNMIRQNLTDIDPKAGPKYRGIYESLKSQILRGELAPGDYLAPEGKLAKAYGVSVGTMKKALRQLQSEHFVMRKRGHGTQVLDRPTSRSEDRSVLVLVGDMGRAFFGEIASGILEELEQHNCRPILHETWNQPQRERALLEKYSGHVQGYIIVPSTRTADSDIYRRIQNDGVPLVFVDRYLPEFNFDAIVSDNRYGGYLGTRHLLDLGHRRILMLGVDRAVSVQKRLEGYKQALAEYRVPYDPELVHSKAQSSFEDAYQFIGSMLSAHPDCTAAFCLPDESAWGCSQRLSEMGIDVPNEFSILGYDDNADICSRVRPRLSTIRQMKRQIGESAARRLAWKLNSEKQIEPEIISLPVELVVRESTARVREEVLLST